MLLVYFLLYFFNRKTHRSIRKEFEGGPIAELSAPDQSVHDVNNVLSYISSTSTTHSQWNGIVSFLNAAGAHLNSWFLQGDATELGVTPQDSESYGAVIARGLWVSHWVEEWASFDSFNLCFYRPLSQTPDLVIGKCL